MAKRSPLVCQHLENISRNALKKHQDIIRNYVRGRQSVYASIAGIGLYYVGLGSNLRMRLAHHMRNKHGESWDRFSVYLTIGNSQLGAFHAGAGGKGHRAMESEPCRAARDACQKSFDIYQDMKGKGRLNGADASKPDELANDRQVGCCLESL